MHSDKKNIAIQNEPFEDVFPIKHGDIPACHVSLPEGIATNLFFFKGATLRGHGYA